MLERTEESWGEKYGEYYRGTGLSPEEILSWQNRLKAEFSHLFKHQIQGHLKDSSDPISSNSRAKHSKVWDMEKDRKVNYCFNTERNYNENWQALEKLTDNDYKAKEAWNVQTLLKCAAVLQWWQIALGDIMQTAGQSPLSIFLICIFAQNI